MIINICDCVGSENQYAEIHKIEIHSKQITIYYEHYNRVEIVVYERVKK